MKQPIKVTEAIFPMPVLLVATYNEDGTIDVMNAAWGTMLDRDRVALNLTATKHHFRPLHTRLLSSLETRGRGFQGWIEAEVTDYQ